MRNELFKGINKMGNIDCYLLITDKGMMVYGNDVEIRAMFSHIVFQLKEHGIEEKELAKAFKLGLMSEEERKEITKEKISSFVEKLFERFREGDKL